MSSSGVSQMSALALLDVHLTEAERHEGDVPVGAGRAGPSITCSWAMRAKGQR